MKKLFLVAVPVGLAVLAMVFLTSSARERGDAYEAQLERARLKRDFSERAGAARTIPSDRLPEWRDEIAALSRWYFDELQAIRNRHPGEPVRPNAVEAAASDRKSKLDAGARAQLEDFQRFADGRLALLREGRYAPVQSMIAEGLRLDLVAVETGSPPEGGAPGLRIDFALWGAPRFLEREKGGERTTVVRSVVPVSFKRLAFHFIGADGKPYGEMSGGGEPYQKLADPERFADDFPPGVLFGTWYVELFPREATEVRLEIQADVRGASGAVRPATFLAQLPVPDGWKLPPGAVFQAEVREAAAALQ
ncbi:hypothetical protein [Anaeromyxobacter sp. Fw109-5]|uniref:hypothetical protein n=1 Tax=Anaeromyxobacter sp. (strain Fw109-5) TaxID=404589 RepID=UPI0000ED8B7E|nr:hypothetical protein [Anaeromyxobacter sp. Fw109-5]ABS26304.1 conserved hypothetical protein [Anaeromyxobacter sp. Fw109-5]